MISKETTGLKNWLFLFIILVFAIIQITFLDYFKVSGIKPDLLLISVVIVSLFFNLRQALFLSAFAGTLKDIFSISTFGINTLILPLWSFLIIKLSKKISIDNNLIRAILVFIIVLLNSITMRLIFFYLGKFIPMGISLRIAFFESLYTAFISIFIFRFIK